MSGPKGCGYQLQLITQEDADIMKVSDLKGNDVAHVTPSSNPITTGFYNAENH